MAKRRNLLRRQHERREFSYAARVDFQDGSSPKLCMIVDISEGGARLRLKAPQAAPEMIKLLLATGGGTRLCQVRWRSSSEIGVQFVKR